MICVPYRALETLIWTQTSPMLCLIALTSLSPACKTAAVSFAGGCSYVGSLKGIRSNHLIDLGEGNGGKACVARPLFCPELKNATNCNCCFVPSSEMLQIVLVFVSLAQKCHKLYWLFVPGSNMSQIVLGFCARLQNATHCNGVVVPDSKMLQIVMLFLSPAQK